MTQYEYFQKRFGLIHSWGKALLLGILGWLGVLFILDSIGVIGRADLDYNGPQFINVIFGSLGLVLVIICGVYIILIYLLGRKFRSQSIRSA